MPSTDYTSPARAHAPSPGYRLTRLAKTTADPMREARDTKEREQPTRVATPTHLALTANDSVVALAADRALRLYHFDHTPNARQDERPNEAPIAEATLPSPIVALATRPGEQRTAVTVALADGALITVDLDAQPIEPSYQ